MCFCNIYNFYESAAGVGIGCLSMKEARGNSEVMIVLDVEFLSLTR